MRGAPPSSASKPAKNAPILVLVIVIRARSTLIRGYRDYYLVSLDEHEPRLSAASQILTLPDSLLRLEGRNEFEKEALWQKIRFVA